MQDKSLNSYIEEILQMRFITYRNEEMDQRKIR